MERINSAVSVWLVPSTEFASDSSLVQVTVVMNVYVVLI